MFRVRAFGLGLSLALGSMIAAPTVAHAAGLGFEGCNAKPSKKDTAEAKSTYERGKAMFDDRDRGAIDLFRSAYLADCTKHELLVVLSYAYQSDGQIKEALAADELYLEKRGKTLSAENRKLLDERMTSLRDKIKEQEDAAAAAALAAQQAARPAEGAQARPDPVERKAKPHSVAPWIVVGVGAAGVVAGAVMFSLGKVKLPDGCEGGLFVQGTCPQQGDLGDAGKAMGLQRAGVIALGAGGLTAIGGLVWLAVDRAGSRSDSVGMRLVPMLGPGSLGVAGTF